jgi:hypothetical protein
MKEKTITVYVTDDGKEFRTVGEANRHQKQLDFCKWYNSFEDNRLYSDSYCNTVSALDVYNWLNENSTILKTFV